MASVSSEALAGYWPLFEYHARKHQGIGGAEFDDLVQEGAIHAWIAMECGFVPSDDLIVRAMLDWIRFISHRGLVYEYTEPLED
jgi:hypothetical protein